MPDANRHTQPSEPLASDPLVLLVPGLDNSGPGHWQSLWEQQREDCLRVELGQWQHPHRNSWVNQLNLAIRSANHPDASHSPKRPIVLVGHSLGCLAVAWWAALEGAEAGDLVAGALLVAPPRVEKHAPDVRLVSFAPTPLEPLPFPSILVASRDDPHISLRAARRLAQHWGSTFADAGAIGHINAESGLADWPFGLSLLDQLVSGARTSSSHPDGIAPGAAVRTGEAFRLAHEREASPARLPE